MYSERRLFDAKEAMMSRVDVKVSHAGEWRLEKGGRNKDLRVSTGDLPTRYDILNGGCRCMVVLSMSAV